MWHDWHGYMGWGWWFLGILFIVLIVWLIAKVSMSNNSKRNSAALDILNERYARGEITKEEYLERKKDLNL